MHEKLVVFDLQPCSEVLPFQSRREDRTYLSLYPAWQARSDLFCPLALLGASRGDLLAIG
ncbi:hypothetical protein D3C84_1086390 [compost metagenome]